MDAQWAQASDAAGCVLEDDVSAVCSAMVSGDSDRFREISGQRAGVLFVKAVGIVYHGIGRTAATHFRRVDAG